MTDTLKWVDNDLKALGTRIPEIQGYLAGSQRVEPDFIHLKSKMTPALIGMVVGNLEKDQEKLKDESVTGLTDIVR